MNSSLILSITTFFYGLSTFLYFAFWVFKKETAARLGTYAAAAAALLNITGIGLRWVESHQLGIGHAPLSNLYESLVFFSFTIAVIYLYVERRYRTHALGGAAMLIALLSMAYASLSPNISDTIQPLIPALKSNWLIAHVITCFLGYAAFAIAFGISVVYLFLPEDRAGRKEGAGLLSIFPSHTVLDDLTYQMVMFGFLFLTIGIITGAVWANSAWGSYWSWDPKETWSLITWFVYACLLHARVMRGWQGKRIAYLSIIGFAAVLFTYFGVNLLPGLHSYGK